MFPVQGIVLKLPTNEVSAVTKSLPLECIHRSGQSYMFRLTYKRSRCVCACVVVSLIAYQR